MRRLAWMPLPNTWFWSLYMITPFVFALINVYTVTGKAHINLESLTSVHSIFARLKGLAVTGVIENNWKTVCSTTLRHYHTLHWYFVFWLLIFSSDPISAEKCNPLSTKMQELSFINGKKRKNPIQELGQKGKGNFLQCFRSLAPFN